MMYLCRTLNGNLIRAVDESNDAEKLHNTGLGTIQYGVTASKMVVPCIKIKNTDEYKCLASNGHQKLESAAAVVVGEFQHFYIMFAHYPLPSILQV